MKSIGIGLEPESTAVNVCHVIGSLRTGGAERQCINLLNVLDADSKHLLLLSDESSGEMCDLIDRSAVKVERLPVRVRSMISDIVRIVVFFKKNRINVVHTHMFWPSLFGVIAARIAGIKVVVTTEHGLNPWKRSWHRVVERRVLTPIARRRICVSEDIFLNRVQKDRIDINKLCVVPNGTPVGKQEARMPVSGRARLLAVGRLIPAKNYPCLIEAASILNSLGVDFELNIVGEGECKTQLLSMITEYSLENRVVLRGRISEMATWFRSADIFVMSSLREGQPVALLEAMAAALPIVATRVGGIPETVEHMKEAILVESNSPGLLAEAIKEIMDAPELYKRLSDNCYQRVSENFSIEAVSRRIEFIYRDCLENSKL